MMNINIHQEPGQELEPEMAESTDFLVPFGVYSPSGCVSTPQKLKQCKIKAWRHFL